MRQFWDLEEVEIVIETEAKKYVWWAWTNEVFQIWEF